MRLLRRQRPILPEATNAVPPTWASTSDFIAHALWQRSDGWFEPMPSLADRLAVVDRCLQLNSQQIASWPMLYKHQTAVQPNRPVWVSNPDQAWYPNGIRDAVFAIVWSVYARGDAFLYVTSRYADGYPLSWTVLDAATMVVEDAGGVRGYRSNGMDLDPRDVLQIQRRPNGALRSPSAISSLGTSLASLYQAEQYAANVYAQTGVNRVALKSTGRRIDREQAMQIQADWVEAVGRRLGAPAILPPDLDLVETLTSVSPKDLLLLESREWDTRQIAAAFGVPAILLNLALQGAVVYQNPEQLAQLWGRTELFAIADNIASAISNNWLPRGHWVVFDSSVATKPDISTRIDDAAKATKAGLMTIDEARGWALDLPPLEQGDMSQEMFESAGSHTSLAADIVTVPDDLRVEVST